MSSWSRWPPHDEALRLYTMRFADEIVPTSELDVPALSREPTKRELEMAERLVDTLAAPWEPERFEDRHRQAVMALIEAKAAGKEVELHGGARAGADTRPARGARGEPRRPWRRTQADSRR